MLQIRELADGQREKVLFYLISDGIGMSPPDESPYEIMVIASNAITAVALHPTAGIKTKLSAIPVRAYDKIQ